MDVSLLMVSETKKTEGMNVCQYFLHMTDYRLYLIVILTCDHEIISDDVGFFPTSVSAVSIDLLGRI